MKPNVRKYWSTGGELSNLFQNHEIVSRHGLAASHRAAAQTPISQSAKPFQKRTPPAGSIT